MLALASGAEEPNQKKRINMTLENSADTQITTANRRKEFQTELRYSRRLGAVAKLNVAAANHQTQSEGIYRPDRGR